MNRLQRTRTFTSGDEPSQDGGGHSPWMAAFLSHELTMPLNTILGSISLLDSLAADGASGFVLVDRKHIDRLQRSGRHLHAVFDGVLKLMRSGAGLSELSCAKGCLSPVVDDALAHVDLQASARGVMITNHLSGSTDDLWYWGDEPSVRQIIVNLLANAVKFTPEGGRIAVSAGHEEPGAAVPDAAGPRVFVRVEDTGRGIPPCHLDRIFEPFQQADAADRHRGTGLGLAISRSLATAMNAEIEVVSEVGVGSAFTLWLPRHAYSEGGGLFTRKRENRA